MMVNDPFRTDMQSRPPRMLTGRGERMGRSNVVLGSRPHALNRSLLHLIT